jgi:hypothetical protein
MYDTTIEHAREYGLECSNPLYIQNLGVGDDVLKYIDEYAKANKHDLIFGHIQQNAEPSVNAIKIMIRKNGYSTIEGNNDFYKYVKVNSKYNDGGEVNLDDLFSDLDLDAIINDLEVKAEKKASKKKYPVKKDTDTGSKTFGKIVFGDEEPSYKKKVRYNDLQDIPLDETEKDTIEEAKIKNYLQNWVSNYSYHEELANEKELFKKLSIS